MPNQRGYYNATVCANKKYTIVQVENIQYTYHCDPGYKLFQVSEQQMSEYSQFHLLKKYNSHTTYVQLIIVIIGIVIFTRTKVQTPFSA